MSTNQGFPRLDTPLVSLVDQKNAERESESAFLTSGRISDPWYRFFISLWTRTGSGEGNVNADWDATTGIQEILNKPVLGALAAKDQVQAPTDIAAQGDPTDLNFLRGDGSWASPVVMSFASRTEAQLAIIPLNVVGLLVQHSGELLSYVFDADGTALSSANGRNWSPGETPTPLHWGAIGDGVTDDILALQAMANFYVKSAVSRSDAYFLSPITECDGLNRQYAVSTSWVIGNIGTGAGFLFNTGFANMKLVAIAGNWAGTIVANVSRQMFVACYRMAQDYDDTNSGIWRCWLRNVQFDCSYLTGGTFLENTNSFTMIDCRISRMGQARVGYDTSIGNALQNPQGFRTGNGALSVVRLNVAGLEEEANNNFPPPFTQDTMATTGIRHRTNDGRIDGFIVSRVTKAMHIDNCGTVQLFNGHPWSREVYIGPDARNIWFTNCYFDFSTVTLDGSFQHQFIACTWPLGDGTNGATLNNGLFLRATVANTTGDGLRIVGAGFSTGSNGLGMRVVFTTSGGGSWVAAASMKIVMQGVWIQTPFATSDIIWQQGTSALLTQAGFLAIAGGGSYGANLDMGSNRVTNMLVPTVGAQAANKTYVDTAVSDERLKTEISSLGGEMGLDLVMALRPVEFKYLDPSQDEEWDHSIPRLGLIAQEVAPLLAAAVRHRGDETIMVDGKELVVKDALGINYPTLIMPLILALQQLAQRVVELEKEKAS